VRLEGLGLLKKSNDTIGNRTRDIFILYPLNTIFKRPFPYYFILKYLLTRFEVLTSVSNEITASGTELCVIW
jgi:hypothetical protein